MKGRKSAPSAGPTTIADLKRELELRDRRITELRDEIDEQRELINRMRERLEDDDGVFEQWKQAFNMEHDAEGKLTWGPFVGQHNELVAKYDKLVRKWNGLVTDWNAIAVPQNVGRPLAASEAQRATVLDLRKRGFSLREIAEETSLGLRTVRTIVDQPQRKDRTSKRHLERIAVDRAQQRQQAAKQQTRDALPKKIEQAQKAITELVAEARGRIGRCSTGM
jgi:DNA repair exonuclease SbcCD ATPase subunit